MSAFSFGTQCVAMRQCHNNGICANAMYLHGDHLGSVSLVTDDQGNVVSQARYTPYGEVRWPAVSQMPTDFGYTGQRADSFGLMDYNARFYSPRLGRFVSADTVVPNPGKAVDFDRYMYAAGNPIRYNDPSGHWYVCGAYDNDRGCEEEDRIADPYGGGDVTLPGTTDPEPGPKLTEAGQRMYDLYWKLYAMANGQFTMEDFLTLILQHELYIWANDPDAFPLFKEAAVRWFYTNWGELSDNAVFNWLGPMQSAGGTLDKAGNYRGVYAQVFEQGLSLEEVLGDEGQYAGKAREIAEVILDPFSDPLYVGWTIADRNRPYSWGDRALILDESKQEAFDLMDNRHIGTTDPKDLIFKLGNQYICTLNQCEYWGSP